MREQIHKLDEKLEELKAERREMVREYIKEEESYLYVSDHAIVRYLERECGVDLMGSTDQERLSNYNGSLEKVRKRVVSVEQQKQIMYQNIENFRISDDCYVVVKGLTVVTVIKRKKK